MRVYISLEFKIRSKFKCASRKSSSDIEKLRQASSESAEDDIWNCPNGKIAKIWKKGRLTGVVDAGEEAVVRELLTDEVQLDAEVRDVALIVHEAVAERVPLPS